jgi:hypothetical protein
MFSCISWSLLNMLMKKKMVIMKPLKLGWRGGGGGGSNLKYKKQSLNSISLSLSSVFISFHINNKIKKGFMMTEKYKEY